jgi:hypothetical protein
VKGFIVLDKTLHGGTKAPLYPVRRRVRDVRGSSEAGEVSETARSDHHQSQRCGRSENPVLKGERASVLNRQPVYTDWTWLWEPRPESANPLYYTAAQASIREKELGPARVESSSLALWIAPGRVCAPSHSRSFFYSVAAIASNSLLSADFRAMGRSVVE